MGNFKDYILLKEDTKEEVLGIIEELDSQMINEFGEYLLDEFFDGMDVEDVVESEGAEDLISKEELIEIITEISDYDVILDLLSEYEDELEESEIELDGIGKDKTFIKQLKGTGSTFMIKSDDLIVFDKKDIGTVSSILKDNGYSEKAINEGSSRIMKAKNVNKKKRKFMKNSKADLRKTKASRKKSARTNRASRKKYRRANKAKIKSYAKSRNAKIKKGTHKVKKRRAS